MERNSHTYLRIHFKELIMRQFPAQWVASFDAYNALEVFDVDDFIDMTVRYRTPEQTRNIMELCIRTIEPEDWRVNGSNPYAVLNALKRSNVKYRLRRHLAEFDREMYTLTRSNECHDSKRILEMFCTKPVRIIQYA